jgi:hypothetical protein
MSEFRIEVTSSAELTLIKLKKDKSQNVVFKAVSKTIRLLSENPRYQGLNTHKYSSLKGPNGEEVFEAYAQNRTPGAYRIFWYYGPGKKVITIFAISAHP